MEELTKEQIKDLEVVVDLAESSEYHDSTNDKSCERVRELIKKIKKTVEANEKINSRMEL
tara:strand:- start:16 stop:195 length:180 start_codon:yes stop_codon:yes gene_type:complete